MDEFTLVKSRKCAKQDKRRPGLSFKIIDNDLYSKIQLILNHEIILEYSSCETVCKYFLNGKIIDSRKLEYINRAPNSFKFTLNYLTNYGNGASVFYENNVFGSTDCEESCATISPSVAMEFYNILVDAFNQFNKYCR